MTTISVYLKYNPEQLKHELASFKITCFLIITLDKLVITKRKYVCDFCALMVCIITKSLVLTSHESIQYNFSYQLYYFHDVLSVSVAISNSVPPLKIPDDDKKKTKPMMSY